MRLIGVHVIASPNEGERRSNLFVTRRTLANEIVPFARKLLCYDIKSYFERNLTYAKINVMKAQLPQPVHESYRQHRKDLTWKIIFPVVLSSVLCIGLIVLTNVATFRGGGDVQRWADISTMWIAIPTMIGMLIVLAVLGGIIYLLARLLHITPNYTALAQDLFYKVDGYAKRGADAVADRIISINSIGASINRIFRRR